MLKLNLKLERRFSRSFQHAQIVFSVIYGSSIFIFPRRVCASVRTTQSPLTRLRAEYFCLRRTTVSFYLAIDGHVVNNLKYQESFFKLSPGILEQKNQILKNYTNCHVKNQVL